MATEQKPVENKSRSSMAEIDLANYSIDQKLLSLIPATVAGKYKVIPLFKVGKTLTVAMENPKNIIAIDEIRNITGLDVSVVKSPLASIQEAFSQYYGISAMVEDVVHKFTPARQGITAKKETGQEAPIVQLVDGILSQAVRERASDVHIEPGEENVRFRYRVDGVLHEEITTPLHMLAPIVSRIKILAGMNIAETRVPQDGRFEIQEEGENIDLRVSSFPSAHGEKIVMRLLDKSSLIIKVKDLGFPDETYQKIDKVIHKPHGIVLVTGPTGSGKTTTLYSVLSEINSKELNITTVEDPIEYDLPGVTQAQVNVKAGLTFATALRSILRQDPDIVFIGEIRDLETATIAIQAAMTGHLVFSTLHTNDAAGAITRLIDMKVEPFLVSSSLEAVLAQRLVRAVCNKCDEKVAVPDNLKAQFPEVKFLHHGKGCRACRGSGYKGRLGIFELLIVDDTVRTMVTNKSSAADIRKYAISQGMKTLYEDGLDKVRQGLTTIDEVLRVTELEKA